MWLILEIYGSLSQQLIWRSDSHRFHLWLPSLEVSLQMSSSDPTRLRGYRDSSLINGRQTTSSTRHLDAVSGPRSAAWFLNNTVTTDDLALSSSEPSASALLSNYKWNILCLVSQGFNPHCNHVYIHTHTGRGKTGLETMRPNYFRASSTV